MQAFLKAARLLDTVTFDCYALAGETMSRNAGLQICSMMMLPQLPFVAAAITLSSKVTFLPFLSLGAVFYIFTAFVMWSLIYARIPDKTLLRQQEAQEPPQECRAPEQKGAFTRAGHVAYRWLLVHRWRLVQ